MTKKVFLLLMIVLIIILSGIVLSLIVLRQLISSKATMLANNQSANQLEDQERVIMREATGMPEQTDTLKGEKKESLGFLGDRVIGAGCYGRTIDSEEDPYDLRTDFNLDKANTTFKYVNTDEGISFEVPYNRNWGNKDCLVLPYLEAKNSDGSLSVFFGKARAFLTDQYHFSVEPQRSSEVIIAQQKLVGGLPDPNPRLKKIYKYEVVIYESYGQINSRIVEVIGKYHNYVFENAGIDLDNENTTSKAIENIVSTFQLAN